MAAKIWSNGWTSVTARCYSSVLFGKQRKIYPWKRCEKKISQRLNFGSSFYAFPSSPCANWACQEGCLLHLRFSLWFSDLPLLYFCRVFPFFVFEPPLFWTLFPILTIQHSPLKRWEAQFFGNRGIEVSLATSCWTGWWGALSPPASPSLISFLRILIVVSI